jgi:hypothetical protein
METGRPECAKCGCEIQTDKEEIEKLVWAEFEQLWKKKFTRVLQSEPIVYSSILKPSPSADEQHVDMPLIFPLVRNINPKYYDDLIIKNMTDISDFAYEYSEMVKSVANFISHEATELVFVKFPVGRVRWYRTLPAHYDMYVAKPICLYARDLERKYSWLRTIPNWTSAIPTIAHNVVDWTSDAPPNFDRISKCVASFAMFGKTLRDLSKEKKCDVLVALLFGELSPNDESKNQ